MKTEQMVMVCIFTLMELNMRVIGLKINNMVMAEKCGPMELFMKDNMKMVKKEGKGKFIWSDGATYEGEFSDNNIHGYF